MVSMLLKAKQWLGPDVVDVSDRLAWPEARVPAYIREQAGKRFDPQVVAAFLKLAELGAGISSRG